VRNFRRLVLGLLLVSLAGVSWSDCVGEGCTKGKYTYPNGDVYEGEFRYGRRSGKGKLTYANGDVYEGDWENNAINGKGKVTYAGGSVYEGGYKDGKRHGKGKYTWAFGGYEGEYRNGQRNGKGVATDASGLVKEGIFKDGKYLGTVAEVEKKEEQRLAELERERVAKAAAQAKFQKIFNACLLDKSSGLDMQVKSIEAAVKATCETIAEDPSWLESLQYD